MANEQERKVKIVRTTLDELPHGRPEDWPDPSEKFRKSPMPDGITHRELYADIVRIALPSLFELILTQLTSMADQIMVGRLPGEVGVQALSAVGLSAQPKMLLMTMVMALNIGSTAMVARFRGQGDQKRANQVLKQSMIINIVLALFFMSLGTVIAEPFIRLLAGKGISESTIAYAVQYFTIQMYGMPFLCMTFTCTACLRGCGDTRMPLMYNTTANVVNVIFNYLLIYGEFGFPRMEVAGASLATVIGQTTATVIAMTLMFSKTRYVYLDLKEKFVFDKDIQHNVITIGLPSMIEQLFMRAGVMIFTRTVSGLGDVAYATHQICMNINSLSFMSGQAFSNGATTLVGQSLGRGRVDMADVYVRHTRHLGLGFAVALASLFLLFGGHVVALYNETPEVIEQGRKILMAVALMQPFQNQQFITNGGLRGAGDTKFSAAAIFITVLIVRSGLGILFINYLDMGLWGAWGAIICDQLLRTTLIISHYNTGKWRFMKLKGQMVKTAK
ncbi:MAG: MATE family efflux transporter [Firmicutes bacterium]|nr:MATE family efflux transporter [Bacillota bacterium]